MAYVKSYDPGQIKIDLHTARKNIDDRNNIARNDTAISFAYTTSNLYP